MAISYKQSGVDIEKGDLFVQKISELVKSTYDQNVKNGVGGFCALYQIDDDRYLASSTDGVGTKIKLAIDLQIHDTIGIDLVAMCVNDLICSGARPLFFLDYFASSSLDLNVSTDVIKGIVKGCKQSAMALIGGETAEMPGMYQKGDYDLAGFSVGEVYQNQLIDGSKIKSGLTLVGLASSGFHSNGFSLVRKIIDEVAAAKMNHDQLQILKIASLTPTRIYVKSILQLLKKIPQNVFGLANITGSGFLNIPRINEKYDYAVTDKPKTTEFMKTICQMSGLSDIELFKTFNMGVGFVVATDQPDLVIKELKVLGEEAFILGSIINAKDSQNPGQVYWQDQIIT